MYPKGYQPSSLTYFDNLVSHSNGNFGMFIKRSRNFRIRTSLFANNQVAGISYHSNTGHAEVQDSTFYARLTRHADTHCNNAVGIKFSLEPGWRQIRIMNSNFIGYANVPSSCTGPGQALSLENLQGHADATSSYIMPTLEGNTFTSNDPEWAFQVVPNQFGSDFRIYLEDSDGAMNPGGVPGFFVHNKPHNTAFLPSCSQVVEGKYASNSELLFCEGTCLRKALFNVFGGVQMVITSRSDSTKTYTYGQGKFDPILPADEYDVSFKDLVTGEAVYQSTNLAFSASPACADHVSESSLFIAQPPPGYFPLYNRFNVSDVVSYSNVELQANSIGYIDNGDWWSYSNVYFGEAENDSTRIRIRFSKGNNGGTLQIRLGDRNGEIIAEWDPYFTGGWGEYTGKSALVWFYV